MPNKCQGKGNGHAWNYLSYYINKLFQSAVVLHKGSTPDSKQKTHKKVMGKILVAGKRKQSNRENHEQQKYFWNVIVLQEKSQSGVRKLRTLISFWFCG